MIDIGLFLLRISFGGSMCFFYGWSKIVNFSQIAGSFPDPLAIGSKMSLSLVVFAEVFCAIALSLGLFTRLAAIPLLTTMIVALAKIHHLDPWTLKMVPLMYAMAFGSLVFTGGGRIALSEVFK
jgi:putative oxidoreductase